MVSRSAQRPALAAGVVLDGKYRIEGMLGQGGMGFVVAAWHLDLDERVALKFLRLETISDPSVVERFSREARAAAKIKGEHVCRVLDVGRSDAYGPYLVMEYLVGEDLGRRIRHRGPMPLGEAVGYVLQACLALAEAHGRGIVHRDLKPANLFLTQRPDGKPLVKVLDFGISKMTQRSPGEAVSPELTTAAVLLGSYAYMAPEQARNARDVDARADIWALGVILHKLVSGALPFEADSPSEWIAKIVADPPTGVRESRSDLPADFERIVLRCLEKQRERRFSTVAELATALGPFAPGSEAIVGSIARVVGAPAPALSSEHAAHLPAARPTPPNAEPPFDAHGRAVGSVDLGAAPTEAIPSASLAGAAAAFRAAAPPAVTDAPAAPSLELGGPSASRTPAAAARAIMKTERLAPGDAPSGAELPGAESSAGGAPIRGQSLAFDPGTSPSAGSAMVPAASPADAASLPVLPSAPFPPPAGGSVSTMTPWSPSQAALLEGSRPRPPLKALLAIAMGSILGVVGVGIWLLASGSSDGASSASADATAPSPPAVEPGSSRAESDRGGTPAEPPPSDRTPIASSRDASEVASSLAAGSASPSVAPTTRTGATKSASTGAKAGSTGKPPKNVDPFGHL